MPKFRVYYFNVRDPHRLLTENVESWTIFGVYKKFIANARTKGDVYLQAIRLKMPKIKKGK